MLRELKILSKIDFPYILKVEELLFDYDKYYMVTEKCSGNDLQFEINNRNSLRKKFTEEEVVELLYQILTAISYMHNT